MPREAALILAAGRGRRMGEAKALLSWRGKPLALAVARPYLDSDCEEILLVVGAHAQAQLRAHAKDEPRLHWVRGADPEEAMWSSVRRGIEAALERDVEQLFIQPVDAGPPDAMVLRALRASMEGALAAKPVYQGRGGHPLLLSASALQRLDLHGAQSLRHALSKLPEESVRRVSVEQASVLRNWNRPEDVQP